MTDYLEPEDVEALLRRQGLHVKDRNLLLSALAAPLPVFGVEVYPTLYDKAAALNNAINSNHPMQDGNKRTSWLVSAGFLLINGVDLDVTQDEIVDFTLAVANHQLELDEIAGWFRSHARPVA